MVATGLIVPIVALAMSIGAAVVGSAFSPINPFQVQIAQGLAELPLGSAGLFRIVFLVLAMMWAFRVLLVRWPRLTAPVPAYAIGGLAAFWFIDRAVLIVSA